MFNPFHDDLTELDCTLLFLYIVFATETADLFLGASAKLLKATISFLMSVRME
jgi:hypothetical protein